MRYSINFDKTINQLTPHYIGGRKLILLMQALASPLQILNKNFAEYAAEKRIEASMTSQILPFTWFLNRKFKKYFLQKSGRITITDTTALGVPIYNENAGIVQSDHLSLYTEQENKGNAFYYQNERIDTNSCSFIVHTPAIDTSLISKESYISMLTYWIERYRVAGKTYKIVFDL